MRRKIYTMDAAEGIALLERAQSVHVATTDPLGRPVLKAVHGVVRGDHLYWHGSPGGEKARCTGRMAVVSAHEVVAEIPSHWVHPERACPATTYYRSVQVHGVLEAVESPVEVAAALQALMDRYQPDGGFVPILHDHPLYRDELRRVLVVRVSLRDITAKGKLGQNRTPEEIRRIVERLWQRGTPRDLRAIDTVLASHPASAVPETMRGPRGTHLIPCVHRAADVERATELLRRAYWNIGRFDGDAIRRAITASCAVVGARSDDGELVGVARAVSDDAKRAWIYDVCVQPEFRGHGVGRAVLQLLLKHRALRDVREVHLGTRDAQAFYASLGFGAQPVHMVMKQG